MLSKCPQNVQFSEIRFQGTISMFQFANFINDDIIGGDLCFAGPFGLRPVIYCDYIASGKPLHHIENSLARNVLPCYGNTHSSTNICSISMTTMREQSRSFLKSAFNATEEDALIFAGSGCTGAVDKLVGLLGLGKYCAQKDSKSVKVFVSLQEHHSNLLPWRECGAEVITIAETLEGKINLKCLEKKLIIEHFYRSNSQRETLLIGCFTAASNITGQMNDDVTITALLHKYGALSFWDYAAAAPYVNIDMNPKIDGDTYGFCKKDALYFSCHKFLGGPQTPGILIAKKKLFKGDQAPAQPGGGTVRFVTSSGHMYLTDPESKEEGGTPGIVESIRAGLVVSLKEAVSIAYIAKREYQLVRLARKQLGPISNLVFLGNGIYEDPSEQGEIMHLPILSFLVKAPEQLGGYLHHNFFCSLLNDLFGIQARGGCACAGPYAQELLGMSNEIAESYANILKERSGGCHCSDCPRHSDGTSVNADLLKPGFARLCLPWHCPDDVIEYILEAIKFIADHGWKFLVHYVVNLATAGWTHFEARTVKPNMFKDIPYVRDNLESTTSIFGNKNGLGRPMQDFKIIIKEAESELAKIYQTVKELCVEDQRDSFGEDLNRLRWFILPIDAKDHLISDLRGRRPCQPLFKPKKYRASDSQETKVGSLHGGEASVGFSACLSLPSKTNLIDFETLMRIKDN